MYRASFVIVAMSIGLIGWTGTVDAEEKTIKDIPKDAWEIGTVWTEPIKGVIKETHRVNPVSGLWHGLWQGSVKSVQRTAEFLIQEKEEAQPNQPVQPEETPLLRYSF